MQLTSIPLLRRCLIPAVALALPAEAAGRALSAYNLAIFSGVFAVQWGIGLVIDAFNVLGWSEPDRYRSAVGVFLLACLCCLLWGSAYPAITAMVTIECSFTEF